MTMRPQRIVYWIIAFAGLIINFVDIAYRHSFTWTGIKAHFTKPSMLLITVAGTTALFALAGYLLLLYDDLLVRERRTAQGASTQAALLRALLDNLPDSIYFKDRELRFLAVSQAKAAHWGLSPEQVVGKTDFDFFDVEQATNMATSERQAMATGEPLVNHSERLVYPDGSERWALTIKAPYRDPDGNPAGIIGISHNITQLKEVEAARALITRLLQIANTHTEIRPWLEESVTEIQQFTGCQAVGIRLTDDTDNLNYEASSGFSQKFHQLACPLSVKSDTGLCVDVIKGTTDPERPFHTEADSFYVNSLTCFRDTISEEEKAWTCIACHKAGYESIALIPIVGPQRTTGLIHLADSRENKIPLALVQTMESVAMHMGTSVERLGVEAALRESENSYRVLVEHLPQKIFLKDNNSVYISCNQQYAEDLGISPQEIGGRTDHDFFPKELADKYRTDDQRIIASGNVEEVDEEYIQDGQRRFVHTVKTPVTDETRNVAGVLGIFWDITEQKQAEEERRELEQQLFQAQKLEALGTLAGGVAHDFNNLLTGIIGMSQLALQNLEPDSTTYKQIAAIPKAGMRAAKLIDSLLVSARRTISERRPLALVPLVEETVNLLERTLPETIEPGFVI